MTFQPTQNERVLAFLLDHPDATALDIAHGCHPWVSNPRARISDLRANGHRVDMVRRPDGKNGFRVVDKTPGVARIEATDSKAQVERKMADAFSVVDAALEAWREVFGGDL